MEIMMIFEALFGVLAAAGFNLLTGEQLYDRRWFPMLVFAASGAVILHFWIPMELARIQSNEDEEAVKKGVNKYIKFRAITNSVLLAALLGSAMFDRRANIKSIMGTITIALLALPVVPVIIMVDMFLARMYGKLLRRK